ncbi:aldehyde dehydrogenase (NAD) family protein [[Eubacterium] yurii subsp. margaretiae ATCC 43715]|nr:aldehyde dehydrogenase (NAD) family protein [[Eubacterium] yurii subsp. margaretiae ATCC 43715]
MRCWYKGENMKNLMGVFSTVNDAIASAKSSFYIYSKLCQKNRQDIIEGLRRELLNHIDELAIMSQEETGMGKIQDKATKIRLAISQTPGTEDFVTTVKTGDGGVTFFEYAPYGIACAIQPSTNPCETMINNTIGLLAAGNSVINCPHPRAIEVSKHLTDIINRVIFDICGIDNLVVTLDECMLKYIKEIMNHPDVDIIVSTGGSDNARAALSCGKKVISAGAANPTFIVDETADISRAAYNIVKGASFDNNITCVGEKNIIVVEDVLPNLRREFEKDNVYYVDDVETMLKLSKVLLTEDLLPNKLLGGKDVSYILETAGIYADKDYDLIAVETVKIHPFVTQELLMPLITVVKVKDFEEALDIALMVEQNLRHTAGIHSGRIDRLNLAERVLKTSIFVKNGSSLDGIGICGVGGTSFTIANVTGEGAVTAKDFARKRRSALVDAFSMR